VDEIQDLFQEFGVDRFVLNSSVVLGYDARGTEAVEGIAHEILRRGLPIRFSFVTHPGHLRRNLSLLPLLLRAGLESVYLGIDSILERARALYGVPFDAEDIHAALRGLHDLRVPFRVGYIFYDPYTTLDEIGENLAFLRAVRPLFHHLGVPYSRVLHDQVVRSVLTLGPRLPVLDRLRRDGLLLREASLEQDPLARFQDASAGRFLRLHGCFNRDVLPSAAPFLFNADLDRRFPELGFFLLDALELLRRQLKSDPKASGDEILATLRSWSRNTLSPAYHASREAGIPRSRSSPLDKFFSEG
jgi:hypothetical protein